MSDTRRVKYDPKQGKSDMSTATVEAFEYLNALTREYNRGWGDTHTAARDRVAKDAGISPAQAERLWKRWQRMSSVDGDVYRGLRNLYETVCERTEAAADALEARRLGRTGNAVSQGAGEAGERTDTGRD
jgi:hypothetical protein